MGITSAQIFVFIFTIITFIRQWKFRNWKPVFSHSDPAIIFAKAAELQKGGKEVCIISKEGIGAAYGFLVGHLAERIVLAKEET